MVRVLHLRDHDSDFQTERGVLYLTRDLGGEFTSIQKTIGAGGDASNLPRAVLAMRREDLSDIDLVHAWGSRAFAAAALGTPRAIVFSPSEFPRRRDVRW